MQYVFHEPNEYGFSDRDGHDGKFFGTESSTTQHLIVECHDKLRVFNTEQEVEFNYYVIEGEGHFIFNGQEEKVAKGDLIVIPPGTKFTFGGKLKMLLINTPRWTAEQESLEAR